VYPEPSERREVINEASPIIDVEKKEATEEEIELIVEFEASWVSHEPTYPVLQTRE